MKRHLTFFYEGSHKYIYTPTPSPLTTPIASFIKKCEVGLSKKHNNPQIKMKANPQKPPHHKMLENLYDCSMFLDGVFDQGNHIIKHYLFRNH